VSNGAALCTLDAGDPDSDYAQWAAVERDFTVGVSSMVQAITFSYGEGTNGHGMAIAREGSSHARACNADRPIFTIQ
jgi:hypothetical protein